MLLVSFEVLLSDTVVLVLAVGFECWSFVVAVGFECWSFPKFIANKAVYTNIHGWIQFYHQIGYWNTNSPKPGSVYRSINQWPHNIPQSCKKVTDEEGSNCGKYTIMVIFLSFWWFVIASVVIDCLLLDIFCSLNMSKKLNRSNSKKGRILMTISSTRWKGRSLYNKNCRVTNWVKNKTTRVS